MLAALLLGAGACSRNWNRFRIVDVRAGGERRSFVEDFSEGYFNINDAGTLDLVLRRQESNAGPDDQVTQVVHVHGVWRSIPGRTVAESSQLNGTVVYAIQIGRTGATYEGAGSLFFDLADDGNEAEGSIDRSILRPARRLPGTADIFQHVELSGRFRAVRDPRQTIRLMNEIERRFSGQESALSGDTGR